MRSPRFATAAWASPSPDSARRRLFVLGAGLLIAGCRVGPEFVRPPAPTPARWSESGSQAVRFDARETESERWWELFGDPVLTKLVEGAYRQNLDLQAAGLRVLQAQARRAIAIGDLFPQQQELSASYERSRPSRNTRLGALGGGGSTDTWQAGFDAAWEVDLWGRFRRAIEASDADLLAAVGSYDDVLVTLVGEVAATYVRIRVLEEQLAVAHDNVRAQSDSLKLAQIRFEVGGTSELDVQQATTLLRDTEATIPQFEIQRRQATNALCVLLGMPPRELGDLLGASGKIPTTPLSIATGIPADLLRRRPDVRVAEEAAAAQSARIGVAVADLLPSLQLGGTIGVSAEDAAKLFEGRSLEAAGGPSIRWPVLNYGRLINNVRLQDAAFQEAITRWESAVLAAEREVEDAIVAYVRGIEQVARLTESVVAANRAVELSVVRYREGATDYTAVLNTQQAKLREDDLLVSTRGRLLLSVISLYKALGGGWELRGADDFVPEETRGEMAERTYWGSLLPPPSRQADVHAAEAETREPGFRHWRWWWPKW